MAIIHFENIDKTRLDFQTKILKYPDGVRRLITMQLYQWDWFDEAKHHHYSIDWLLNRALIMADELPTEDGREIDIQTYTIVGIGSIRSFMHEDKYPIANDA